MFKTCSVLLLAATAACTRQAGPDPETIAPQLTWHEVLIPDHPGAPGRSVVRDAVHCGATWWVVGAVFLDNPTETRDTRPAAWRSADGRSWEPVSIHPATYWGRRAILNSIGCSQGSIAVVGARSGGAHGYPRVTTFRVDARDDLVDVAAVFTQYGGVNATNVGPIGGSPSGWLMVGNRLSGPAVWVTDDPRSFTLLEGVPGLTENGGKEALAQAPAWAAGGWFVVGAGAEPEHMLDRDPMVWRSTDALTWHEEAVPSTSQPEDMQKAVELDDGRLLVLGTVGERFGSWVRDTQGWTEVERFGSVAADWRGTPYVSSVVATGRHAFAALSTAARYELWSLSDGGTWARVATPTTPATASDHTLALATNRVDLLLVADGGAGGQLWLSHLADGRIE